MRTTRRFLVVVSTVLATGLLAAAPAQAGGWEETVLDPPPARVEAGVTYTFGYWILPHGSYPYQGGDLKATALRATGADGSVVDFAGTAAATRGHYSAEVTFPHEGRWTIGSHHEMIAPDPLVATVTVPGPVVIAPSEVTERAGYAWGTVRPSFPPAAQDAGGQAPVVTGSVAPRGQVRADEPGAALPVWLVVAAGAATAGLAGWLVRRYRRVNAGVPGPAMRRPRSSGRAARSR